MPTIRKLGLAFSLVLATVGQWVKAQTAHSELISLPAERRSLTVREALQLISRQTSYRPSYVDNYIPFGKKIQVESGTIQLTSLLDKVVESEDLRYEFRDNLILIVPATQQRSQRQGRLVTMSGAVTEAASGEVLIGATIWIDSLKTGTSTNAYGFYSISLPPGCYKVNVSFVGFQPEAVMVDLTDNLTRDYALNITQSSLPELVVSPADFEAILLTTQTGYHKISRNIFGKVPYFLSEVDVLQGALLLPGVRNVGEDASGINVRGGSPDNNLILLDEAIVFNTSHFFGLISVFNPDAINDMEIYKGDIPAAYGGRISSVVSVRQKEGNKERFGLSGGVGLLSGRLVAEGPLVRGKSSFLVSGRSSLFNINYGLGDNDVRRSRVNFSDFNVKLNHELNPRNKIYLSGYFGKDRNRVGETFQRSWGNSALTARWNHTFGNRLFSNHTFTASEYSYKTEDPSSISNFIGTSYVSNYSFKSDYDFYKKPSSTFRFGYSAIVHRLNPGNRKPLSEDASVVEITLDNELAVEPALYGSWERSWNSRFRTSAGLRYSRFYYMGPSNVYLYQPGAPRSPATLLDTLQYDFGEVIDFYQGAEPRLVAEFKLSDQAVVKASYNRSFQYIHRISNSISPAPTDIWKLSDNYILPEIADQWSVGYYKELFGGELEASVEAYYRDIDNTIAFKDGADLILNETIETEILQGIGRGYGTELLLRKPTGDLRGWVSYTLSRAETRVAGNSVEETLNSGEFFPSDYDRTHDLSVVGLYNRAERWSFSATFNFSTGRPVTLPVAKYVYDGVIVPSFTNRNQGRLSNYHRLDLSATLNSRQKEGRRWQGSWTFSVYNVYARRNAYSYLFRQSAANPAQTEIIRYSVLGTAIPSVSYNFKF